MLANAAQILVAKERRLNQGHHRDSALLHSRNDTFSSLHVQRTIADAVADGFRPERSMPEPPFTVSTHRPPKQIPHCDPQAGEWVMFTSRHEALHSTVGTSASAPPANEPETLWSTPQKARQDRTAKLRPGSIGHSITRIRILAESETRTAEGKPAMYVCNGPWSALHKATQESTDAYFQDRRRSAMTLKPRCGCTIGIAAMAVWTAQPGNACRRKGCV